MSEGSVQPATPPAATGSRAATWTGLFVSLFGMLIIRSVILRVATDPRHASVILIRELLYFSAATGLLLLVKFWEKKPLASIGIGTASAAKSMGWGLLFGVICFAVAAVIALLTHYGHGEASKAMDRLPTWLLTVVVFRAGIVEELFYRGYAMERLREVGLSRGGAFVVPLVIFGLGHYTGGGANIVIALVLGGILAAFYDWKRDLNANIFAHTLVDFVANVVPRLAGM
jgi:membrane protease YdiL (CAAX protease family)